MTRKQQISQTFKYFELFLFWICLPSYDGKTDIENAVDAHDYMLKV